MKRFVLLALVFMACGFSVYAQTEQIPGVVVSDFTSRARDVHEDDLVTVMEMFMNTLATSKTVNVIDRTVLERAMTAIEFGAGDWSDSVKTTRLGEELNAIYLISGTMTQLGTSLTFSISVRDIKTLVVITSDQKQYTLENVWDNSVGIPAQLTTMGNTIASGISTEQNKRQQEVQAQIARQEAEAKLQREKEEEEKALVGSWVWSRDPSSIEPYSGISFSGNSSSDGIRIYFHSNGTFTATYNSNSIRSTGDYNFSTTFENGEYSGTYIRDGNNLTLTWSANTYWRRTTNTTPQGLKETDGNRSSSGNEKYTISFTRNSSGVINGLRISGSGVFGKNYSK